MFEGCGLFWNKEKRKLSVGKKKKVSENETVRDVLGMVVGGCEWLETVITYKVLIVPSSNTFVSGLTWYMGMI